MKDKDREIIQMNRDYYNQNADAFIEGTMQADMSSLYDIFESHIPEGAKILDLGFGSGRDTLHFLEKGYEVVSVDISEAFVERARNFLPNEVRLLDFHDLDYMKEFDAIWACASLLHCTETSLQLVIERCIRALKTSGILYMSFKKGDGLLIRRSRCFLDIEPTVLEQILGTIEGVSIQKIWITEDVRKDRDDEWVNILVVKGRIK
jgi:SAM-dependent methyltransferase